MLKGFEELSAVPNVHWDFSAPGWPYLMVLLTLLVIFISRSFWYRWQNNSYRRAALKTLDAAIIEGRDQTLKILPSILKSTAMTTYGRKNIASIHGKDWINFLNGSLPTKEATFENSIGKLLIRISYQNYSELSITSQDYLTLIHVARRWIIAHSYISEIGASHMDGSNA